MNPKRIFLAAVLVVAVVAVTCYSWTSRGDGATRSQVPPTLQKSQSPLIVHEWGTFTSFSGSDSVKLEFRPLHEADLPPFVLNRGRQAGSEISWFSKGDYRVLQRMETPVTYFYSDQPRQVSVRVRFPQGLLTEFYPPIETMSPPFEDGKPTPVGNSLLDWGKVWIIPEHRLRLNFDHHEFAAAVNTQLAQKLLPPSGQQNHYAYARETDSALIYVERPKNESHPFVPQGAFFEKFLFYRGIGNFDLPLKLTAHSDNRFELLNVGKEEIRSLFLVTVDGAQLHFVKYNVIQPGEQLTLSQAKTVSTPDQLASAVAESLVKAGLYEKEARAMVNTWQSSWFGEQGTRLFYLLPQSNTDELLPLEFSPQPKELIRIMVGRMEIMTPADEARITEIVKQSADTRAAATQANPTGQLNFPLPSEILCLGRLAEPALVRVENLSKDANIRSEADRLLRELLRQQR